MSKLQWTPYGEDNWQDVDGVTEHWYGEGLWKIADSWFADKPANICFRVKDCQWMDHRGIMPATLYNKIGQMVDGLKWVTTNMGSGNSSAFTGFYKIATKSFEFGFADGCWTTPPSQYTSDSNTDGPLSGKNFFSVFAGEGVTTGAKASDNGVSINFKAAGAFGLPLPLKLCPDGTTILEAKAELYATGLERTREHLIEGIHQGDSPSTTVEDITFSLVAFTSPTDFEVIGSITADHEHQSVVDITELIEHMLANRGGTTYVWGYGVIFVPAALNGSFANMESLIPPDPAGWLFYPNEFDPCGGSPRFVERINETISWDAISFGQVAIKLEYPQEDKERTLVIPMFPSMAPAVPPGMKRYMDGTLAPL